MMPNLFRTKAVAQILAETESSSGGLKRTLSALDLTTLGVGAIIGTGIFVLTGVAAATQAGPGIMLSFVFAGVACIFSALCYAEFASMLPIAGSAYTYTYATIGEFMAWIIGWDLILEYTIGASAVSVGWSGYLYKFLQGFGIQIPVWLATDAWSLAEFAQKNIPGQPVVPPEIMGIPIVFNLPAALIVLLLTVLLAIGIRESARFNAAVVAVKVGVVLFVIVAGLFWVRPENWDPFLPFGVKGIFAGAAYIFFAYIGFDAVSTTAEEAKNPQRDLPIGIIASLLVCTVLYILVCFVLTGLVPYEQINHHAPISAAFADIGMTWAAIIISIGALAGLTSVLLVLLLSQPRIFFAMSRDGLLLPWFSRIHPVFKTPINATLLTGVLVALMAGLTPIEVLAEMTNIGTLFAFSLVCLAVIILRHKAPHIKRSFRTPWVPLIPILGIAANVWMMAFLQFSTWARLIAWLGIGLIIYFTYSWKHSRLNQADQSRYPLER